jgi:hypothetical protein
MYYLPGKLPLQPSWTFLIELENDETIKAVSLLFQEMSRRPVKIKAELEIVSHGETILSPSIVSIKTPLFDDSI